MSGVVYRFVLDVEVHVFSLPSPCPGRAVSVP
jgi:hypothetical protein